MTDNNELSIGYVIFYILAALGLFVAFVFTSATLMHVIHYLKKCLFGKENNQPELNEVASVEQEDQVALMVTEKHIEIDADLPTYESLQKCLLGEENNPSEINEVASVGQEGPVAVVVTEKNIEIDRDPPTYESLMRD